MTKVVRVTIEDGEGLKYTLDNYPAQMIQQFFGMGSMPNSKTGVIEQFHNGNNVVIIVLGPPVVCDYIKGCLNPIENLINS